MRTVVLGATQGAGGKTLGEPTPARCRQIQPDSKRGWRGGGVWGLGDRSRGGAHLDGGAVEVSPASVVQCVPRVALVLKRHEAKALGAPRLLVKDELRGPGWGGGWGAGIVAGMLAGSLCCSAWRGAQACGSDRPQETGSCKQVSAGAKPGAQRHKKSVRMGGAEPRQPWRGVSGQSCCRALPPGP